MRRRPIQVLEVRSELGAGTRGASLGIGAIKVASLNMKSDYFAQHPLITIPHENEMLFWDSPHPFAKYIDGVEKVYTYVSYEVANQLVERQHFPIVLAGDHSTAGATIAGIRKAYPHSRLGVVWIDAHADLHTPYTTPSGNIHGMPLAVSLGIDNLDCRRNEIPADIHRYWEKLKNMGNVFPKIYAEDLVFIAVRDTEQEEDYLMEKLGIRNVLVNEVRQRGAARIVQEVLEKLNNCDMIYVSFDVDSMDCDLVSRGTGTPVPNGLTAQEAGDLLCGLIADPRTCCFEITEVNPLLDNKGNKMAETAFAILQRATQVVEQPRKWEVRGREGKE